MKVKWKRSSEGFCESVDGRWYITPLYCGRTTPEFYELWYYPHGMHCTRCRVEPRPADSCMGLKAPSRRIRVLMLESTQRECKEWVANAEDYPVFKGMP